MESILINGSFKWDTSFFLQCHFFPQRSYFWLVVKKKKYYVSSNAESVFNAHFKKLEKNFFMWERQNCRRKNMREIQRKRGIDKKKVWISYWWNRKKWKKGKKIERRTERAYLLPDKKKKKIKKHERKKKKRLWRKPEWEILSWKEKGPETCVLKGECRAAAIHLSSPGIQYVSQINDLFVLNAAAIHLCSPGIVDSTTAH